ncbi:MAG: phytanoyl-CoA dioxygenase family protein [Candidatus Latescibacteria bacterium]|nr:phytanoyl-CoA dioxygenase family protein [Candidatus Latescibacterota bacterium]
MQLTQHQINSFQTFGFLVFRRLFGPDEVAWITEGFEYVIQTYGGGKVHDGSKRTFMVPTIDYSEQLCRLLDDARIVGIASDLLGEDFNYGSGDGNYYSGDTGWHPDGHYPDLFAIKMAFYLDPLSRETGCLRVLPGSHRFDSFWRTDEGNPRRAEELWGILPPEVPGNWAVETNPGDLVVFNHSLFHASFGGNSRRRMFTMNLIRHGQTESELARVDGYLRHHCPVAHGFKIGGMYTDLMLDTAGPERLRHLAQLHERHALVHPNDTRPSL